MKTLPKILASMILTTAAFSAAAQTTTEKIRDKTKATETKIENKMDNAMEKRDDKSFVKKAAKGNQGEIELAQIALEKSKNADLRKFAQHMIDDHSKAAKELGQIAAKLDIKMPNDPDLKHEALKVELKNFRDDSFDRRYLDIQAKDHQAMAELFRDQAANGQNAELKAFAAKTLATIESHIKMLPKVPASK